MLFWLGVHKPRWLERLDVPLMVSHRQLSREPNLPRARAPWALDSGAFSEIAAHGRFLTTPVAYAAAVRRYSGEIGNLAWAAPQDWMCEPIILRGGTVGAQRFAGTGLSVAEHQRRTIASVLELRWTAADLPWIPVLQGFALDDYGRHVDAYARAGIDLGAEPLVGLGSVCRRQATSEIDRIVTTLAGMGFRLHGFGVKTSGLGRYGWALPSAAPQPPPAGLRASAWREDLRELPPLRAVVARPGARALHRQPAAHPAGDGRMSGPPLRILSLGAGVQSSCVLLMSIEGELDHLDAAIFSDTGWEPAAVYAHLARLEDAAAMAGGAGPPGKRREPPRRRARPRAPLRLDAAPCPKS